MNKPTAQSPCTPLLRAYPALRHALRALLFFLPLLLLLAVAECALRSMPNTYRIKSDGMAAAAPELQTIVLGASHTLMGINPALLSTKAYNLAGVSQTLDIDCALLASYLPQTPQLQCVVVCADAGILFDPPLSQGTESFRCTYYNLYTPVPRIGNWPRLAFETASYTGAKEKIKSWFRGEGLQIDAGGFYTGYTPDLSDTTAFTIKQAAERTAYHLSKGFKHLDDNRRLLFELYEQCQKHNLRFILITTPTHPLYQDALPDSARTAVSATLGKFRGRPKSLVLDYSSDKRFTTADFFDLDHLNTRGAAKFTRILSKEAGI